MSRSSNYNSESGWELGNKRERENNTYTNPLRTNKKEKIKKIKDNFRLIEQILKKDEFRKHFTKLSSFTIEECSKFIQNIANYEYLSLSSSQLKSKDPIMMNILKMDFNPEPSIYNKPSESIDEDEDKVNRELSKIQKIIIKNTKEKIIKVNKNNINKSSPALSVDSLSNIPNKDTYDSIIDNIDYILESNANQSPSEIMLLIKLYTEAVQLNNFDNTMDDKLLLLIQKSSKGKNEAQNNELCYSLISHWIYIEYLHCDDRKEYYRYDMLLNNIINSIKGEIENVNVNVFSSFISNIPRYTESFIDYIISYHQKYFKANYENLKKDSQAKKPLDDQLKYLPYLKKIYFDISRGNKIQSNDRTLLIREKIMNTFLEMTRNDYNHLNVRVFEFLFAYIYDHSRTTDQYEKGKIEDFAIKGLKELLKITGDETQRQKEENTIQKHFFLYFYLCIKNIDVCLEFPDVYSKCAHIEFVKEKFDNYLGVMLNQLESNNFIAEKLVTKCDEKCEEIVKCVIKLIKFPNDEHISDMKVFQKIRQYYKNNQQLVKGIIEICSKIPLCDFYSDSNLMIEKMSNCSNEENEKICMELNKNENSIFISVFGEECNRIKNKIILYILYFYSSNFEGKNNKFLGICKLFVKFYIRIFAESGTNEEKDAINNIIVNCINPYEYFDYFDIFNVESDEVQKRVLYCDLVRNLNAQIEKDQNKFNDATFEKLKNLASKQDDDFAKFKVQVLKKLDERIKSGIREKDLIEFNDL